MKRRYTALLGSVLLWAVLCWPSFAADLGWILWVRSLYVHCTAVTQDCVLHWGPLRAHAFFATEEECRAALEALPFLSNPTEQIQEINMERSCRPSDVVPEKEDER